MLFPLLARVQHTEQEEDINKILLSNIINSDNVLQILNTYLWKLLIKGQDDKLPSPSPSDIKQQHKHPSNVKEIVDSNEN